MSVNNDLKNPSITSVSSPVPSITPLSSAITPLSSAPSQQAALISQVNTILNLSTTASSQPLRIRFYETTDSDFIDQCIEEYTSILKRNPEDPSALFNRAMWYRKEASFKLALEDLDKLLKIQPKNIDALILQAKILVTTDRNKAALAVLDQVLHLDKNNAEALSEKGQLLLDRGDEQQALLLFSLSYKTNPRSPKNLLRLASLFKDSNKPSMAEVYTNKNLILLNELIARQGDTTELLEFRIATNRLGGKLDDVCKDYETLLERDPQDCDYLVEYGRVLLDMNRLKDAEQQFDLAIEFYNDIWAAHFYTGLSKYYQRDIQAAFDYFVSSQGAINDDTDSSFYCALCCLHMTDKSQYEKYADELDDESCPEKRILDGYKAYMDGESQEALEILRRYLEESKDTQYRALAYFLRGRVHQHSSRLLEAVTDFTEALKIDPYNHFARNLRAVCYETAAALSPNPIDICKQALADYDFSIRYLNLRGKDSNCNTDQTLKLFAQRAVLFARLNPDKIDQAFEELEIILQYSKGPRNSEIHSCKAMLFYLAKNYQKASESFLTASGLQPKNADPLEFLYKCYLELKQFDKARDVATALLRLEPDNEAYKLLKENARKLISSSKASQPVTAEKKAPKIKKVIPKSQRDDITPQFANLPKPELPVDPESEQKEARIRAEVEAKERKEAEKVAKLKAEKEANSLTEQIRAKKSAERTMLSHAKPSSKGSGPLTPEQKFQLEKARIQKLERDELRKAARDHTTPAPTPIITSSTNTPAAPAVVIFRRALNIDAVREREFDPSLFKEGEFNKKEQEVRAALPEAPKVDKATASAPKNIPLAFLSDKANQRISTALHALERIEILLSNPALTLFESTKVNLTILENLRLIMDSFSGVESRYGEDKDFEVMANQILVSTKAAERLSTDISKYCAFIDPSQVGAFCKALLASDLKKSLQELHDNHGAWSPQPGKSSSLLNELQLVPVQTKVNLKKTLTVHYIFDIAAAQLRFLNDMKTIHSPTKNKLKQENDLKRALSMSMRILANCSKKIKHPIFLELSGLANSSSLDSNLAIVNNANEYLKKLAEI